MLISRTPYRISLFGGGTDYCGWYSKHGGAVLSTTINHYAYLTARWLPPFHNEKSRVVWSKIESVADNDDIQHPAVREILRHRGITTGIEIHHTGDLPARSGLGSSSTFTVGLLNAVRGLQGYISNKHDLAQEAIYIERDALRENVGVQDQIAAAHGGMNRIEIAKNGAFNVVSILGDRINELESHLLLFFTGVSRTASDIALEQTINTASGSKDAELHRMQQMVDEGIDILHGKGNIDDIGTLLHESWQLKRSLARNISPQFVDDIYSRGLAAGAIGGKLLGAGGGGFMLFFAKPENHDKIRAKLKELLWVPFKFENQGSQIIFNQPSSYSRESLVRRDYTNHGL